MNHPPKTIRSLPRVFEKVSPLLKCHLNFWGVTYIQTLYIYKLGYVKGGSTTFKVEKDGCGVPSAARATTKVLRDVNAVVPRVTWTK